MSSLFILFFDRIFPFLKRRGLSAGSPCLPPFCKSAWKHACIWFFFCCAVHYIYKDNSKISAAISNRRRPLWSCWIPPYPYTAVVNRPSPNSAKAGTKYRAKPALIRQSGKKDNAAGIVQANARNNSNAFLWESFLIFCLLWCACCLI